MARLIKRGQVWIADLNPGFGIEIRKKRPVLIISNDQINKLLPTIIVVPVSSQVFPLGPEKVLLPKNSAGLDKDSVVLAPTIKSIDKVRLVNKIGKLKQDKLLEIEDSLKLVLGMIKLD